MLDYIKHRWDQQPQVLPISRDLHIPVERMEKPEGSIRSVIEPLLLSFGEHVWDEPVTNVMCECPQNPARFGMPAGSKGQALEADHGVASPVREPVVAGNHAANLVACRTCSCGILS